MQELLQGSFASQLPAVMTSKESFNLKQLKVTPPQPPPKKKRKEISCVYTMNIMITYKTYIYIFIDESYQKITKQSRLGKIEAQDPVLWLVHKVCKVATSASKSSQQGRNTSLHAPARETGKESVDMEMGKLYEKVWKLKIILNLSWNRFFGDRLAAVQPMNALTVAYHNCGMLRPRHRPGQLQWFHGHPSTKRHREVLYLPPTQ